MSAIWDDRLAEVWAAPGLAGAGVVVGAAAVLTARHLVVGAGGGGSILSRVIRPGAEAAGWVPMTALAEDEDWDVALLGVDDQGLGDGGAWLEWLKPSSLPPVFVRLGTSAERDCEAVGFPQSEVQHTPDGDLAARVRQSEHVVGTLLPAGQAKKPVNPERPLPRRWMPLDVEQSTPGIQAGWGGMSGAGIVLGDGRLAGLVVAAESGHQQRRLYVVPLYDVLAGSGRIAEALAAALEGPAVIEAKDAPHYRDVLRDSCLTPEGAPILAGWNADAMNNLGLLLTDSDPEQARRWLEGAAEAEHAGAMFTLGWRLRNSDPEQARRWLERAAEAGEREALYSLGWLVRDSDPGQARRWLQRAADAGHAGAMFTLGWLVRDTDPAQARRWFDKAADAGDAPPGDGPVSSPLARSSSSPASLYSRSRLARPRAKVGYWTGACACDHQSDPVWRMRGEVRQPATYPQSRPRMAAVCKTASFFLTTP
jgi:TPR repeat protein